MSQETGRSSERSERKELPIERGYPIEQVNEIVDRENRAKRYYRPLYTMHKWWARRLGSVFRTISLYTLLDDPQKVSIIEPGNNGNLGDFGGGHSEIQQLLEQVDLEDPESLWELYPKDVRVEDKKVLDPFMGGGTSLIESSRFGASVVGNDLNPVAWFVTKKELEAGQADLDVLNSAFDEVERRVEDTIDYYYSTSCPTCDNDADVMYYLWVNELDCTACSETVSLFKDYRVAKGRYDNKGKYNILCPDCESIFLVDEWRENCTCPECEHEFTPAQGNADGADYSCRECGQRYAVMDAVNEQGGFEPRLYAIEYYCPHCDDRGLDRSEVKGYKMPDERDIERHKEAVEEWENNPELRSYVPSSEIPLGIKTDSAAFDESVGGGHNLLRYGYTQWTDLFSERQLLCLSQLLKAIDEVQNEDAREYLLTAFSDSLMFSNTFTIYNLQRHNIEGIFRGNYFKPQKEFVENHVFGTKYGRGTFRKSWDKVIAGVEWAKAPVERYIVEGSTEKTEPFGQPVGDDSEVICGDIRDLDFENEFDAVLTDPPYYNNVIYSELSNFFYVWQRLLLSEDYDEFEKESTPRAESIVTNPAEGKNEEDFERELRESFSVVHDALKSDGVLAFTYHHSNVESWGELLEALCDVGFEVTATYPVTADTNRATYKLTEGDAVSFDIIIVARPASERDSISWNSLRRQIYRTAQQTRQRLEENRNISRGDIGVIEMGECFHEYSKHHGKVMRAGEEMSAKEVVEEIYGVIQQGSEIGEIDVFLDLLETEEATYDDLNKLTRGTNASPEQMKYMSLYRRENGKFILGTWDDEKRMAYIQERVNGDDEALNALDKAQFLRYRYEQGKSTQNYLSKWDVGDELRELCEGLADATGDDTYRRILGADSTLGDF